MWQRETPYSEKESTHPDNPYCSATPVTDGTRVIASLGSAGMVCYDFSGKEVGQKERLSTDHSWGSFVAGAGRLYVTNHAGETLVLKADPPFELLAKNKIGERVLSSCAVSDGEIFIRSYQHLWCIGEKR